MKAATLNEIRKELIGLDASTLQELCLRLGRYRLENKELLTYLLFEADDEQAYISNIKAGIDALFEALPKGNVYFVKKGLRKILRFLNKHVRYSGLPGTELEARIHFCSRLKGSGIALEPGTVLYNLYHQQLKKIRTVWSRLPEDLQFDYERDIRAIA